MPTINITQSAVNAIEPKAKPTIYYDAALSGFGVRVMPTGSKSWIVEYRPSGGGRGVATTRMTLGATAKITAEEARKSARAILARALLGDDPGANKEFVRSLPTVRELSEKFLKDHAEEHLKPSTQATYRRLCKLINGLIGSRKINLVGRADARAIHREIARTAVRGGRREGVADRAIMVLSAMFTFAVQEEILPPEHPNPVRGVKLYDMGQNFVPHYLSHEELERVGRALNEAETIGLPRSAGNAGGKRKRGKNVPERIFLDPHAVAGIRLLILTGMRKGEMLGLTWDRIDFERGLILLPNSKTGRKTIVLNSFAVEILKALPRIGPYVIAGPNPSQRRADLRFQWMRILLAAGVANARLHDLRHTHASIGVNAGVPLAVIGKILGHTSTTTTERYAHLETDPVHRGSERIGKRLSMALGGRLRAGSLRHLRYDRR